MQAINILILEDDPLQAEALKAMLETHQYHVIGVAKNNLEALKIFHSQPVDLAILDIFLEDTPQGIAFAETIHANPKESKPFVFLTSSTDRAVFERAKLTQPFSYLLKPYNELELLYALEMAIEKFYGQEEVFNGEEDGEAVISDEYMFIKKGRALKKVLLKDIIYIEVTEKYCDIITEKEKYVVLISLKKMLNLLGDKCCRSHRNHIVNLDHIQEIIPVDNLIKLSAGFYATLSDKYKDLIKKVRTLR